MQGLKVVKCSPPDSLSTGHESFTSFLAKKSWQRSSGRYRGAAGILDKSVTYPGSSTTQDGSKVFK